MNEYKLIATNFLGESIDLWNDSEVTLTSIEGVSMNADVSAMRLGAMDGSSYIGSRLNERDISFIVQYHSPTGEDEAAKLRMYRIFRPKKEIILRYISPLQDKYIVGYCAKCETPPMAYPMVTQIEIKAEDPYWKKYGGNSFVMCGVEPSFEFAVKVTNNVITKNTELNEVEFGITKMNMTSNIVYAGDTDSGFSITFNIYNTGSKLGLMNIDTNEYLSVSGSFQNGDVVTICTVPRKKSITLERENDKIDYFTHLDAGSSFLMLSPGSNKFKLILDRIDISFLNVTCTYDILYGGV